MANKVYDNFYLSNEIEDQYNSHLDLQQFCTVDNSLVGTAGMIRKINVYKATNGTEKLDMGEGNTKSIEVSYSPEEYKILLAQNRFKYYDEQDMTDPMLVPVGVRHMGTDMFNTVNADIFAEFNKATQTVPVTKIDFGAFADANGELDYTKLPTKGATWATNYIRPSMRWSSTRETLPVVLNSMQYTYNNTTTVLKGYNNQTRLDLGTFTLFRSSNKASTVKSWLTRMANGINIYGIRYYPFTASCVPMFWYEPMDQVRFVDSDGKEYNSIITSCTYTVNGTMELQSAGESANKSDNATKYRYNGAINLNTEISKSLENTVIANLQKIHANTSGLHTGEISGNLLAWLESTFESTSTAAIATASEESEIMLADVIETTSNDTATIADTEDEEVIEVPAIGTSVWRTDEDGMIWCTSDWQGDVDRSTWTSGVDAASDLYVKNLFAKTITASGEIKYQSEDGTAITVVNSGGIATKSGNKDIYIQSGMVESPAVRASEFYGTSGKLVQLIHSVAPVTKSAANATWTKILATASLSPGYYTGSVCCTFPMSSSKGLRVAVTAADSSPSSTDFIQDSVASTLQADHITLPVTFAITTARPMYIWARQTSGAAMNVTAEYDLLYIAQTPTSEEVANG